MSTLGTLQEPGKAYLVLPGRRAETRAVGECSPGPTVCALVTWVGSETVNSDLVRGKVTPNEGNEVRCDAG